MCANPASLGVSFAVFGWIHCQDDIDLRELVDATRSGGARPIECQVVHRRHCLLTRFLFPYDSCSLFPRVLIVTLHGAVTLKLRLADIHQRDF